MDLFGPVELSVGIVLLVLAAGFSAGWIDAVVGGGGLLQLPVMLLVPGLSPVQALATNKMGSVFGTAASAATYARRVRPDLRTALPMAAVALLCSLGGAVVATVLPAAVIRPVILVALVGVALVTALRPQWGLTQGLKHAGTAHALRALAVGAVVGFYDGVLGPGTGTFLILGLVGVLGYDFLQASAKAKIVNLATNVGALAFFLPAGHVVLGLGLLLGAANLTGGYVGARMAISRGTGFIRAVFLVVVCALILRLAWDVFAPLLG
ncbi:TSUP family transporter [Micrococcus sp. ACRRV]|uniref:sulfite exporter TauE/SafE family protein n=1 Tax=Micrococcus sp. ACRRV TaxID=2918203 RepID=UPI001EF1A810|nr:TSUP family transporter [Micrococcus sp. ACRRV]MCG7422493.1 TSUP family transporter [Micrococcus sp. ACRRV]